MSFSRVSVADTRSSLSLWLWVHKSLLVMLSVYLMVSLKFLIGHRKRFARVLILFKKVKVKIFLRIFNSDCNTELCSGYICVCYVLSDIAVAYRYTRTSSEIETAGLRQLLRRVLMMWYINLLRAMKVEPTCSFSIERFVIYSVGYIALGNIVL